MNPNEISEKKFEKSKVFGYRTTDVDEFKEQIYKDYEILYRQKNELEKKVDFLAEKLMEYREQENKLTDVLLEARKVSDNVVKKAQEKAEAVLLEAQQKANVIKMNLKREVDKQKLVLQQLQKETKDFKNKILLLYKSQVDLIATLPASEFNDLTNVVEEDDAFDNFGDADGFENKKNSKNKVKERTFSISLDENGVPVKIDEQGSDFKTVEGGLSDTQNIALQQDIKKVTKDKVERDSRELDFAKVSKADDQKDLQDNEKPKYKEPLKFGANYSINSKKNKK